MAEIKKRERDKIVQSLRAGVPPSVGLEHIQVGRTRELLALENDLNAIVAGDGAFRIIEGDYGAGKTFFLHSIQKAAMTKKLVVMKADLAKDARLHGNSGQAQTLYSKLVTSMRTTASPDGDALQGLIEKFLTKAKDAALQNSRPVLTEVRTRLEPLRGMVKGDDFAAAVIRYCEGIELGKSEFTAAAKSWLSAQIRTKTDAKSLVGASSFIDDNYLYYRLLLISKFVTLAGYKGLLVCLDEMIHLYNIQNSQARRSNFEEVRRILDGVFSEGTKNIGFFLGAVPEFVRDSKRGCFSYEDLASRLATNPHAKNGLVDFSGPVISLNPLSINEIFVLLEKVRHIYAMENRERYLVPDVAIEKFLQWSAEKLGSDEFVTPRNIVKSFIDLLAIIEQNPGTTWESCLSHVGIQKDLAPTDLQDDNEEDDDLTTLRL
jgi:ribosomal protein L17